MTWWQFSVLFNSISVITEQKEGDYEGYVLWNPVLDHRQTWC